jgi:hypothetical protein
MHNSHPHGQKVMKPHKLNDHLMEGKKGVAKLPDAMRETHREEEMYHNPPNAEPTGGHNPYGGGGGEPEE